MAQYISKDVVVAEIEKLMNRYDSEYDEDSTEVKAAKGNVCHEILCTIDSLEVEEMDYEQYVQYDSIRASIQAHAETYSFNIKSELFNQLTKEQQALWRKEIEQACISGGYNGLDLAKDPRYKKNLEVKEVDLEKKATQLSQKYFPDEENVWARANIEAQRCKSACIEMVEWLKA